MLRDGRIAHGAAGWLSLAAAPTFALMAAVTVATGDSHGVPLCSQAGQPSALAGMGPMYLLMAAFHLAPWLKTIARMPKE